MRDIITCNRFEIEYEITSNGVCITGYSGRGSTLSIPATINTGEGILPVTAIGKKALLGIKGLKELTLPNTITEYGDWAFARCDSLRVITIPTLFCRAADKRVTFGRRMFDGCVSLEQLSDGSGNDDLSYLCAALVARMPSEYLLWDDDIGSSAWYDRWDLALTGYIYRADHDGYSDNDNALCGEEDISYDGIASVDGEMLGESYEYIRKVSMNKCNLCLTRCVYNSELSEENKKIYERYLLMHKKGSKLPTAWMSVKNECGDKLEYYQAYIEMTATSSAEIPSLIEDLDEEKTQIRAYLISLCNSKTVDEADIFESLKL